MSVRRGRTARRPPDRTGSRGDTGASGLGSRGDGLPRRVGHGRADDGPGPFKGT